jgi:hypothetical protein
MYANGVDRPTVFGWAHARYRQPAGRGLPTPWLAKLQRCLDRVDRRDPELWTVRARPGRLRIIRALSIFYRKSVLYAAFVWARRALNSPKRWPARVVVRGRAGLRLPRRAAQAPRRGEEGVLRGYQPIRGRCGAAARPGPLAARATTQPCVTNQVRHVIACVMWRRKFARIIEYEMLMYVSPYALAVQVVLRTRVPLSLSHTM